MIRALLAKVIDDAKWLFAAIFVLMFFFLFLLFVRFFPVIAMSEVKSVLPQANPHWEGYDPGGSSSGHAPAHAAAAARVATPRR